MPTPDWTKGYHRRPLTAQIVINGQQLWAKGGAVQLNSFDCGLFIEDGVEYALVYIISDIAEPAVDHPVFYSDDSGSTFNSPEMSTEKPAAVLCQHADYALARADYDEWPEALQYGDADDIRSSYARKIVQDAIDAEYDVDMCAIAEMYAVLLDPDYLGPTFAAVTSDFPDVIQSVTETDQETGATWTRDNVWRCNLEPVV